METKEEVMAEYGEKPGRENWGYGTDRPCCVCGSVKGVQEEPRFGYSVCINHQHVQALVCGRLEYDDIENHQCEEKMMNKNGNKSSGKVRWYAKVRELLDNYNRR